MKTEPRRFRNKLFQATCGIVIATAGFFLSAKTRADGCFVASKFVWDKHKDINEPTQKAIIAYDAGQEDLILQVKYNGPVEEFGWLIPVPNVPTVTEGSMGCFYEISQYTQQLWGHPVSHGGEMNSLSAVRSEKKPEAVKVIETKTVGAYEIAVLSATEADALKQWLNANQFIIPRDKADVIESYVKKRWYFVAARINLGKTTGFAVISGKSIARVNAKANLEEKLSSGELRPLHLAFASEKCVFPLKISSINGKSSEVQIYILSSEPLLEKSKFVQKLPAIYSNDVVEARKSADSFTRSQLYTLRLAYGITNLDLPAETEARAKAIHDTPRISGELPAYAKVTKKEIPRCSKEMSRLEKNAWWLNKQTWIFKPEEMEDLEFEPAVPILASHLDSRYGYYTAACLAQFGSDGMRPLLEGLQGSNAAIRAAIISAFESGYAQKLRNDPAFRITTRDWIKSPNPEIRLFVVEYVGLLPEELLSAMHDEDSRVARLAGANMMQSLMYRPEAKKYIPAVQEMLNDKSLATREAAIGALRGVHVAIPRADLLQFFKVPDLFVVATALSKLEEQGEGVSNEDVIPLLQNTNPEVRAFGLKTLYDAVEKRSVELALPLLEDSEQIVRSRACDVLADLTGQNFPADQPGQWQKWWADNKATLVLDEEKVLQRRGERARQRVGFPTRAYVPSGS